MTTRIPVGSRSVAVDALIDRLDSGSAAGYIEVRTGAQPSSADAAATGTLLATITLGDPAFGAAVNGVKTANAIAAVPAAASGTAGWFRAYNSSGVAVLDGSVSLTGGSGDLQFNTTAFQIGTDVTITSWTVTLPAE